MYDIGGGNERKKIHLVTSQVSNEFLNSIFSYWYLLLLHICNNLLICTSLLLIYQVLVCNFMEEFFEKTQQYVKHVHVAHCKMSSLERARIHFLLELHYQWSIFRKTTLFNHRNSKFPMSSNVLQWLCILHKMHKMPHIWNYFETRHGKGEHDGAGACIKTALRRKEKKFTTILLIRDAKTIVSWCSSMIGLLAF